MPAQSSCAFGEPRQPDGTCAEPDAPLELPLDLHPAHVSGHILFNGAVPPTSGKCMSPYQLRVTLTGENGSWQNIEVSCESDFEFSAEVPPDRYSVSVTRAYGSQVELPFPTFHSKQIIDARSGSANVDIDVRTVHVSGTIVHNGVLPAEACAPDADASIRFGPLSLLEHGFEAPLRCEDGKLVFDTDVFPDTHTIMVRIPGDPVHWHRYHGSFLNSGYLPVLGNAVVDDEHHVFDLDVGTASVTVRLKVDGKTPVCAGLHADEPDTVGGVVSFENLATGAYARFPVKCGDTTTTRGMLLQGDYLVRVEQPLSHDIGLVDSYAVTFGQLHVGGDMTVKVDVPASNAANPPPSKLPTVTAEAVLRLNGGDWHSDPTCDGGYLGTVVLPSPSGLASSSFDIRCGASPKSTYPITVAANRATVPVFVPSWSFADDLGMDDRSSSLSSLPFSPIEVAKTGDRVTLDLRVRHVTGTLTFDGAPPTLDSDCEGNVGSIRFALPSSDIHTDLAVVCTADGLRFNGWLATNQTYDVSVTTRWPELTSAIWGRIGTVKVAEQ